MNLSTKYNNLIKILGNYAKDGLIVTFSGGVDSGFLLYASKIAKKNYGGRLLAFTTYSESMPMNDSLDAKKFTATNNIEHIWQSSNEIDDENYVKNDGLRCYYCKTELFHLAKKVAEEKNYKWIAYGYNSTDTTDIRPGHKAAIENGILYPLAESNLSKDEIRTLMRENNLEFADKPASPCLSSRIMTNVRVTKEKLKDIDELENLLRLNGLTIFRLRLHEIESNKFLRLEVTQQEIELAFKIRGILIIEAKKKGYKWVTLDLEGYKLGGANL
ncbi:MAG: ATP-dependent sacrificial sulfur transferase LarE [Ignavibacteriaceae bacterium]